MAGGGLGLPAGGAGRVASWGARVAALAVDWFACLFASFVFASPGAVVSGNSRWLPLVLLVVESAVLTATLGGSAGQLLLGVRVRRVAGGGPPDLGRARDRRGLHDRAAGTVVVARR